MGFEGYVPLHRVRRRWSDRLKEIEEVLFPGYIFCRFPQEDRLRVLNSPGIAAIVGSGRTDVPVSEDELGAVRSLIALGRPLAPWPYLRIGQDVTIDSGPLSGMRGVVLRNHDSWRVVVSIAALDRSLTVEVDRDMLAADHHVRH